MEGLVRRHVILASEIENERGDFERHFLVFGHQANRIELEEVQLIIERLNFDAPAEG